MVPAAAALVRGASRPPVRAADRAARRDPQDPLTLSDCRRVLLSGLVLQADAEFLRQLCSTFGEVKGCAVHTHPSSGVPLSLASVRFAKENDAVRFCAQYDHSSLMKRTIRVIPDPGGERTKWHLSQLADGSAGV